MSLANRFLKKINEASHNGQRWNKQYGSPHAGSLTDTRRELGSDDSFVNAAKVYQKSFDSQSKKINNFLTTLLNTKPWYSDKETLKELSSEINNVMSYLRTLKTYAEAQIGE